MGIDISLFAKKSKTYLVADRAWVLSIWNSDDTLMDGLESDFRDSGLGLDQEWTLYYLNECLKSNQDGEDQDRDDYVAYWIGEMIKFVKGLPEERFFILTDHMDEYYDTREDYVRFDPLKESK